MRSDARDWRAKASTKLCPEQCPRWKIPLEMTAVAGSSHSTKTTNESTHFPQSSKAEFGALSWIGPFVDNDKRWIIDYKTGTHTGGAPESFLDNEQLRYSTQLESYASVNSVNGFPPYSPGSVFPDASGLGGSGFS